MQYSNLHTHTMFSDGIHSAEQNILSAIEKNMLSLGISDHSYTYCDTSYCMPKGSYAEYLKSLQALKEKYAEKIPVFIGIEKDFFSDIDNSMFDYIIASVHYLIKNGICYPIDHSLKQQNDCITDAFGGNVLDMAKCYFDTVVEHVERSKPTLVGHFDVITKFSIMPEQDEKYRDIARQALKETIKSCPYIEVNTGAISRGWRTVPYPSDLLLKDILSLGGEVVLSSDSHNKNNLTFYFDETVELLKKLGFSHYSVFTKNGFIKQNI